MIIDDRLEKMQVIGFDGENVQKCKRKININLERKIKEWLREGEGGRERRTESIIILGLSRADMWNQLIVLLWIHTHAHTRTHTHAHTQTQKVSLAYIRLQYEIITITQRWHYAKSIPIIADLYILQNHNSHVEFNSVIILTVITELKLLHLGKKSTLHMHVEPMNYLYLY